MLTEAMELGEELGDTEIRAEAMSWRVPTYVALCDIDAARRELAALQETAEQTAQPFRIHVAAHYDSAIALSDGRLDRAEAMAERSHEWSRLLVGRDALGVYGIQMFGIRREQGRLGELAPVIRLLAGQDRRTGSWRPGLVSVLVELGMDAEARRELSRLAAEGLDRFRASLWLGSLTYLTDACTALGDENMAALLYPELEPFAGTNVMIGHLVSCYGAADRYLGMLAATLGEWERADEHFERATELNRRMGMVTWLAHTLYQRARMLSARGAPGAARPCASARIARAALGLPGRPVVSRGADPRPHRPRPQQPRDRRQSLDQRAHCCQPHPQHPAQDGMRQPHAGRVVRAPPWAGRGIGAPVGSAHATVRDRAQLRRGTRPHER
jgi:tetratricopeptide (TPR) repeat protein